ncbi:DUF4349 domain-containing protein [Streptomyces sp. NPDC060194]|uniref:DUF4349 domain-containing protein n=1 Tax=Streptomyces sp. NPDC060194 TaxID=3347069 RepID=UPI003647864C
MGTNRTQTVRRAGAPRRALAALFLAGALALTGCTGGGDAGSLKDSAGDGAKAADRDAKAVAPEAARAEQSAGAPSQQVKLPATHIIRTAELSIRVKSADKALAEIRTVAGTAGGCVTSESVNGSGDPKDGVEARVVVRVPQPEFADVLEELEGAGRTTSRDVKAKDVTEQVVDVESRVRSQRASVIRVRELMDKATKLSDVVVLEGELSSRQAELEALLSRQASLKDRTTMSTITLNVEQPAKGEKLEPEDDPGLLDALKGGWNVLVAIVTWLLLALAAAAPFLLVAALAYLAWRAIRSRRRTPAAPAADPAPQASTLPEHPSRTDD